jgi:4-hydroxy 2-oxovalerate aldolase
MKDNIAILDCTLRDGGYVNDWKFGHNTLINIFERLTSANIDFVEVGFLDQRRTFDTDRSIMPDTASAGVIYRGLDKKNTCVVAMIDYGTCDISHIQPCGESFLDGIRVIFKKNLMHEALAFCKELKCRGYKVFTQAVSITSYDDNELLELIDLVNDVQPFAVSIVDTYGLLHKNKLFHYYEMLNAHLNNEIGIGYHSHNNFQLGYANCIELAGKHAGNPRLLLLDGSAFGMGKGAGNAPTELLAMHMNDNLGGNYDISQILEAMDVNIMEIFKQSPWGYSMKFFIAASNNCHPNYVSYLLDKQNLSIKSVNEILKGIESQRKLLFDQSYIEQLYVDYQQNKCHDAEDYQKLSALLKGKKVLIIGPGVSINSEADRVSAYIKQHNPVVLAINFIPHNFDVKYLFLTNSKRYVRQATIINQLGSGIKIIATSNLTKSAGEFDYNLDYETLIDRSTFFMDNSFIMLLKVMIKIGVRSAALAGFDGYSFDRETNYYSSEMEYQSARQKSEEINTYVNKMLAGFKKDIEVNFITSTLYRY